MQLAHDYKSRGVNWVAISANDIEKYPQDSPEQMAVTARQEGYPFPYLYDKEQNVAKAYKAACTPDFYVFNDELNCVYRGQLDESRPGNGKLVTGSDIRMALDNLLAGQPIDPHQKPSVGCNIKWK